VTSITETICASHVERACKIEEPTLLDERPLMEKSRSAVLTATAEMPTESRAPEHHGSPCYELRRGKLVFSPKTVREHRQLRTSLWSYMLHSRFLDRSKLHYLNALESLNCVCCYANGLTAFVAEIAGRTEQHWCPIKHARVLAAPFSLQAFPALRQRFGVSHASR